MSPRRFDRYDFKTEYPRDFGPSVAEFTGVRDDYLLAF